MSTFLIITGAIFFFIFHLFLGNISYALINNLPHYSENSLNIKKGIINTKLSPFRHHKDKREYHRLTSHVPIFGYMIHQNKKIKFFELKFAIFNMIILSMMFFFNRDFFIEMNIITLFFYLIFWSLIISLWNIVYIIDLRHYIIPDVINLLLFILSLLLWAFTCFFIYDKIIWMNIAVGLGIFIFFLFLGIVSGGGMGGGDVKFIISSGIIFGNLIIFLIFISSILGILYKTLLVPLFHLEKEKETPGDMNGKKTFPFGPFLIMASYIVLIFSQTFAIMLIKYIENVVR